MNIDGWNLGCVFLSTSGETFVVEDCPDDGTCSSKVTGVWYSNAEIKRYLRKKEWRPWSGMFEIVPWLR